MYGNATESFWVKSMDKNTDKFTQAQAQWMLETERCRLMFHQIDQLAWHLTCKPLGQMDLLRSVPCLTMFIKKGGLGRSLCKEEDDPERVIDGAQFTYTVQDLRQPR